MRPSGKLKPAPIRSFVVRLYRYRESTTNGVAGVVQGDTVRGPAPFRTREELWKILTTVPKDRK